MTGRLVFLDTETTGLESDADVWDFAVIIRDPGQPDVEMQFFVEHDEAKAARLPEPFLSDYRARYSPDTALIREEAASRIADITRRAHIVGAVPNFDTQRLERLLFLASAEVAAKPEWHYHLIDVETLAVGWLYGASGLQERHDAVPVLLPWDSDALSLAVGVTPPAQGDGRHTALGDARWTRAVFDAITRIRR